MKVAHASLVWIFFIFLVLSVVLFSTVVAKSAILIYNPSRDLQKTLDK